ncbi:hypothetical protein AA15669_1215 [Saccharibacter floricola DSM 15669]|uniref:Uncharacterized protein n=1 Tax=Saccharibacter floricola DSM 15669 TaxID=1123227 RepID=A0ABQ0P2I6_9PROT|nr:hypothetical protein AA15669_1215 [Saccharibacter floricola DSM 15669]
MRARDKASSAAAQRGTRGQRDAKGEACGGRGIGGITTAGEDITPCQSGLWFISDDGAAIGGIHLLRRAEKMVMQAMHRGAARYRTTGEQ